MKTCLVYLCSMLYAHHVSAQGCSDAGICSAGGMHPGSGKDERGSITLNMQYGVAEQDVQIFTPQLELVMRLNKKSSVQLKLPYVFANGNIGSNQGFGDIVAVLSYRYFDKDNKKMGLNAGVRIGVNNANTFKTIKMEAGAGSLPMPYQTSLGTHDFLIGTDFKYKEKWLFALGVQIPLIQFNNNQFDTVGINKSAEAKQYFSSNQLIRKPDIVLRADRIFKVNKKLSLTGGLLGIYHLLHDRAINAQGKEAAIHGTKGLTLNIPVSVTYKFSETFSTSLRFASPVIVRKVRPDGLTRHYVLGLELKYSF